MMLWVEPGYIHRLLPDWFCVETGSVLSDECCMLGRNLGYQVGRKFIHLLFTPCLFPPLRERQIHKFNWISRHNFWDSHFFILLIFIASRYYYYYYYYCTEENRKWIKCQERSINYSRSWWNVDCSLLWQPSMVECCCYCWINQWRRLLLWIVNKSRLETSSILALVSLSILGM